MTGEVRADHAKRLDCLFLFFVILLSAFPSLKGLGFYSDDWSYQSVLTQASGQGAKGMFKALLASDSNLIVRPVQAGLLVVEFKAFGLHPLPYHMLIAGLLGLVTVLVYLALRAIQTERLIAFVIALNFGLLPHYSTDRFWFSSQQALVCLAFALLGIYALCRSLQHGGISSLAWAALASIAMALSLLAYEIAIGLIAVAVVVFGWRASRKIRSSSRHPFAHSIFLGLGGTILLAVVIFKLRSQTRIAFHHHLFTHLGPLTWRAFWQATVFNLWTYGMHMPAVLIALYRHSALTFTALSCAAILAFFIAAYVWKNLRTCAIPSMRNSFLLIVAGFALFELGFALFFTEAGVDFSSAGLDNRVEVVSALGAACVLTAIVSLASIFSRPSSVRIRIFGVLFGLTAGLNSLVVSGIGFFWDDAATRQKAILASVAHNAKVLPPGSTLLLDGFCRYSGPAVIFETDWDATGAIRLTLHDDSLHSDVISPYLHFDRSAAETTIYGEPEGRYSYSNRLFVFNTKLKILTPLASQDAANLYIKAVYPNGNADCPAAREGNGETIF